ncbi:MAG: lysophospholipid acyltransferase family protein [Bacteriovoracales bacterium]|nr:lysophospholipid acyltransferase family protein [Bacteriovoracales bacterium]
MEKIGQLYGKLLESLEKEGNWAREKLDRLGLAGKPCDPWGLDPAYCLKTLRLLAPLYRQYFKVRVYGAHHVQDRPYVLVSNHSGQIAIDGLLIFMAMALDVDHPRIVRPMMERFMIKLPFVGEASLRLGGVLGDRQNCIKLLEEGQSVLVFPEGVRGVSKSTSEFYRLQPFTRGFFRMALAARKEILPIAVVGAEEFYPFVYQAKGAAKRLGLPALPITPLFPWLGPLGAVPLPSPIDIHIGPPIPVPEELGEDAPNRDMDACVLEVKRSIGGMLKAGLKKRRKFIDPKAFLKNFGVGK